MKVLISDKLSAQAVEVLKAHGVEVDVRVGMSPDELRGCIGEYDGLAIRSATKVTADVLAGADKLKVIGRAGIGVDNVDIPAATARGVVVMNTPFGNSVTTAEHAVAMMMALARNIPAANVSTHAGKWEKSRFMGMELAGKTLGLIGCGNIGSIVANRAQGLKMQVAVYDPYLTSERARTLHVEKVDLAELLTRADVISLHTPLNDATRNIINAQALSQVKRGVRIINCARGGLIDEAALKEALISGQVAGAAMDVFAEEPAKDNPLFGMDNVICTPHLGASTAEAQEKVALQVAQQMAAYLTQGTVTNALNIPSVSAEDAQRLRPYLELTKQLGQFAGQLTEHGIKKIRLELEGHAAQLNDKPLLAVALQGVLSALVEGVNMVNAPLLAAERGIEVSTTRHERPGAYNTLVRITLVTEQRTRTIAGTLFGGTPRVVEIHGVKLEAGLGAYMLYVNNEDQPGLIGNLGKMLGDADINVANFHLGRNLEQQDAIALLELDHPVNSTLLKQVAALPDVKQAKTLQFAV